MVDPPTLLSCWFTNLVSQTSRFITKVIPFEPLDLITSDRCLLGFHSDLNATYPVGTVDDDSAKLIRTTRECLDAAIRVCKPGALFRDIGKAMSVPLVAHAFRLLTWSSEPIARANNCAVVRTYTGHGVNDLFHTAPNIPHYAKNKAVGTMKPGMVSGPSIVAFWLTIDPISVLPSNQ